VCNIVGRVTHTLPEGEPVFGVTSLDNQFYLLRCKPSEQIEVYDVDSYCLQHCLNVPRCGTVYDMVACGHNHCIYVADTSRIHKVDLPGGAVRRWSVNEGSGLLSKWSVNEGSGLLSLTVTVVAHNVLVTCCKVRKIKEFTTDGQLVREIVLPQHVSSPLHTVQLSSGDLVVCHGNRGDPLHRVCLIGSDGQVVKSHGGPPGAGKQQVNLPLHMAVDGNDFIFVADPNNQRVLLLSPTLTYIRDVVSSEQLKWRPSRLSLDVQRRRLYVADDEIKDGKYTAGRVIV